MTEVDEAMHALARDGFWYRPPREGGARLRAELRTVARERGVRLSFWGDARGGLGVRTFDGLPAEEPWRSAVEHLGEIGALMGIAVDASPVSAGAELPW